MKRHQSGFTLIELLVVIAIIGLLSTLAVVALNSARQRSRDASRIATIRQLQTALELGFTETTNYPAGANLVLGAGNGRVLCNVNGASSFVAAQSNCGGGAVYMGLIPPNPTPNGSDYVYNSTSGSGTFSLTFTLEGATGQLGAGANCANQDGIQAGTSC